MQRNDLPENSNLRPFPIAPFYAYDTNVARDGAKSR